MSNMFKKTNRYGALILVLCMMLNIVLALPVFGVDAKAEAYGLEKIYIDSNDISSWAYESIKKATELGFIEGSDGKFNPKDNITRAEFTKLIVGILGLDINTKREIKFNDVNERDWFDPYVNVSYKAEIIEGDGDKFNPNDNITCEQMAAIIVRALGSSHQNPSNEIKDMDKVSNWAKKDVETVVDLELIVGHNDTFDPKSYATREMAAVVVIRGYELGIDDEEKIAKDVNHKDVSKLIEKTADFMQNTITDPVVGSIGGEWTVFGLSRAHVEIPEEYYEKYYNNLEKTLIEKNGKLHRVKYTEYDRVILALTSMGKDIKNVSGYDLTKPLADFQTLIKQGINGPIFALIALDSKGYEIPIVEDVKIQTTREMLVDFILDREIDGGGWNLRRDANTPDPDITGMAIQALTPYYKSNHKVKAAVDRGIKWLSDAQEKDGGYSSWGSVNSESIAQVIVALTGLGIDPHNDSRFVKNGISAVDALIDYATPEGGFYHIKPGGNNEGGGGKPGVVDPMATDQAMYAMIAYDRFINGQNPLYDMTDVK